MSLKTSTQPKEQNVPLLFPCGLHKVLDSIMFICSTDMMGMSNHHGAQEGDGFCSEMSNPLYLSTFMPLVEGGDGDDFWSDGQSRLQGRLIVTPVDPVSGVVVVPRSHGGIHVAWTDAGDKQQVVCITELLDGFPVLVRGAEGETVRGKVSVHAVKAAGQDVMFVALLHNQGNENAIVRRPSDTLGAFGCQELRPGFGWGKDDRKGGKTCSKCRPGPGIESATAASRTNGLQCNQRWRPDVPNHWLKVRGSRSEQLDLLVSQPTGPSNSHKVNNSSGRHVPDELASIVEKPCDDRMRDRLEKENLELRQIIESLHRKFERSKSCGSACRCQEPLSSAAAANREHSTPTSSSNGGCKVLINSFYGNAAVFRAGAQAWQLLYLLPLNPLRPCSDLECKSEHSKSVGTRRTHQWVRRVLEVKRAIGGALSTASMTAGTRSSVGSPWSSATPGGYHDNTSTPTNPQRGDKRTVRTAPEWNKYEEHQRKPQ
ncbi:hypothetical protein CCH79_00016796 [Gambusia affinis]|uniref:Uncharacterized protein n=1 Tax=Gambusia affinis TaxID=33528 RepID=A0A315VKU5_GAMAF|nr:hypothetical protein CCH79_00016796 [Gambusia affinis]